MKFTTRCLPVVLSLGMMLAATHAVAASPESKETASVDDQARAFMADYFEKTDALGVEAALASWKAANTGASEDFARSAELGLQLKLIHRDAGAYQEVKSLREKATDVSEVEARSLALCERAYLRNQLPTEIIERLTELDKNAEQKQNTFRAVFEGEEKTNNDLLEILASSDDSARRKAAWEALKQVGGRLDQDVVALAKTRNEAARKLGFDNYWRMSLYFQEHDGEHLTAIFEELDELTREPFKEMKASLDADLSERFGVPVDELQAWHYDNPFFQAAPPSKAIDPDVFFEDGTKEDIVQFSRVYFQDIGLPVESVLERSSLYEKEGKDQHAFCTNIDRRGDVRILCNIKPTARWMDTQLHELGHAVYSLHVARELPLNVRGAAHALTTEGIAMMFGALGADPEWMVKYAGVDREKAEAAAEALREQRRREQLIFARWTMVMFQFEKALYEDPDQDLNTLWWDLVERYQMVPRPEGRDKPDWAAKPHIVTAPIYYHNYMLGELFAAQLRHSLDGEFDNATMRPAADAQLGEVLIERVFGPGRELPWPAFVEKSTGEPLTARYFAEEVGK